jgi:RNA polymerase sigma-70 factor (ECF subfamily)
MVWTAMVSRSAGEELVLSGARPTLGAADVDAELAARARGGDAAAFEQLYLSHRDEVYMLCVNLCGNREEAQDLLQEVFVRAYRAMRKFRGQARFSTWLHRIAINLSRDTARRRRRQLDPQPTTSARPPQDTETVTQVRATLTRLRSPHRVVLALRYGQSLSYQEIAEVLGWSLPRVKVTLHRAKRAFKDAYLGGDEVRP